MKEISEVSEVVADSAPEMKVPRTTQPVLNTSLRQRNWLVRWIRRLLGITDDMDAGTQFESLTVSNLQLQYKHITRLRGYQKALETALTMEVTLRERLQRRLEYYETNILAYHSGKLNKIIEAEEALAAEPEAEVDNALVEDAQDGMAAAMKFDDNGVRGVEGTFVRDASEGAAASRGFAAMAEDVPQEEDLDDSR